MKKIEIDRETFHRMMRMLSSRHVGGRAPASEAERIAVGDEAARLADLSAAATGEPVTIEL